MDEVFTEFNRRLSNIGQVVIAGGAVRDWLMGREPKDYDVFVLGAPDEPELFEQVLAGLEPVTMLDFHKSEPFLQGTFRFGERIVQVMATPHTSVDALLDSFDWNVCRFAYDGSTVTDACPVESIRAGERLRLHRVTFPVSTLRRGFRFSERFSMRLEYTDIRRLCEAIATTKEAA